MSGSPESRPFLPALTGVRFLAAFYVVLFHVSGLQVHGLNLISSTPWWLKGLVGSGYVAVSLFFTLSGFVLAYTYLDSEGLPRISDRQFWRARFARIYPVYLLGLVVAAPFAFSSLFHREPPPSTFQIASTIVAPITLLQAWTPTLAIAWNIPGWSLSVEAFFYALFPFIARGLAGASRRTLLIVAVVSWAFTLAIPAIYLVWAPDGLAWPQAASYGLWLNGIKFNPLARLGEFMIGVVLGRLFLLRSAKPGAIVPSGGWLTALAAGSFGLHVERLALAPLSAGAQRAVDAALRGPHLRTGAGRRGDRPSALSTDLPNLGRSQLCAVHPAFADHRVHGVGEHVRARLRAIGPGMLFTYAIVMSIAISVAAYRLIEVPGRRLLRGKPEPRPTTSPASNRDSRGAQTSLMHGWASEKRLSRRAHARGDPLHREPEQASKPFGLCLWRVGRKTTSTTQQLDLNQIQRIDVRVAHIDRGLQPGGGRKQIGTAG